MLVCCIAVAGTLAVLTMATTEPVKNTFMAAGKGELAAGLVLKEHQAVQQENDTYTLDKSKEVYANEYKALPGVNLPKDPFIVIDEKTNAPAYLYVEIVNGLGNNGISYTVDTTKWTKLDGVTGKNGGDVYVYMNGTILTDKNAPEGEVYILDGDITVADNLTLTGDAKVDLTFYGYLAQASVGDAATAYNTCFNNAQAGA